MSEYGSWFESVAKSPPHTWQRELGDDSALRDRVLRIPTGFGKTAGTVLPWLHHRVVRDDRRWPTRLVFCLPMRVLVEQTERVVKHWASKLASPPEVFVLLGGREEARWVDQLERPAVLIGTQDMLLSRALNRGYGSPRGLWPMEMGLLLRDALWVVDEVQLMDVGLATTTQLRAFLAQDEHGGRPALRPTAIWWMSATLQDRWLDTIDFAAVAATAPPTRSSIPPDRRTGVLWDVAKTLDVRADATTPEEAARHAFAGHEPETTTLVVLNTVDRAVKAYRELHRLSSKKGAAKPELRLVHSRFRGAERSGWDFLRRDAAPPPAGRVIVATQVVEAGVDISARRLVTDLAPWPSLVQRFGRCARYEGEVGDVCVVGAAQEGKTLPYEYPALRAASAALAKLSARDVGPRTLELAEERWRAEDPALLAALYPYAPLHVLRRRDYEDLFDTTPDLSGADLDVGRYIRTGEERDVTVFWRAIEDPKGPQRDVQAPAREELCPVPVGDLRAFLKADHVGYVRDFVDGVWRRVDAARLYPGLQVQLSAADGGYGVDVGWDPSSKHAVAPVLVATPTVGIVSGSESAEADSLAEASWKSIATHGRETGDEARRLARAIGLGSELEKLLVLAARWHDVGKAHPVFQAAIRDDARRASPPTSLRRDLAKAPSGAWRKPDPYPERPGFRHELASTLALFEVLRAVAPEHDALLGPWREILPAAASGEVPVATRGALAEHPLADELAALRADEFDLVAFLVCAHHGKVRCAWSSTPRDQERDHGGIHGVCEGDVLPELAVATGDGGVARLPPTPLSLDAAAVGLGARYGRSWADRVQGLLDRYGGASLAFLEAVLRVADWRASRLPTGEDQ